jgi:lipoprotein-releasing system permease protein
MWFEWTVALRFLREGGLQTLLIIAGTTAGISVIVFISGFLGDLQRDLIQRTLGVQPGIIVRPAEEIARPQRNERGAALQQVQARAQRLRSVDQWQSLQAELDGTKGIRAVSPVAAGPGLITRGDVNKSITLTGIMPERYVAVTRLNEKIVAGELRLNPGDVVIGTDLAKDLGVTVGDKVRLSTPASAGDAYQVRGIYDLGQRNLNRAYAYVALPTAQALLNLRAACRASNSRSRICSAPSAWPRGCRHGCRTKSKAG